MRSTQLACWLANMIDDVSNDLIFNEHFNFFFRFDLFKNVKDHRHHHRRSVSGEL